VPESKARRGRIANIATSRNALPGFPPYPGGANQTTFPTIGVRLRPSISRSSKRISSPIRYCLSVGMNRPSFLIEGVFVLDSEDEDTLLPIGCLGSHCNRLVRMLSITANIERNAIKLSVAGRRSKRRNYESSRIDSRKFA